MKKIIYSIAFISLFFVVYTMLGKEEKSIPDELDTEHGAVYKPTDELVGKDLVRVNSNTGYSTIGNEDLDAIEAIKTDPGLSIPYDIETIYHEIKNGNFTHISEFHEMAIQCFSIKGYSDINSYIADIGVSSKLEESHAVRIYKSCTNNQLNDLQSLDFVYQNALKQGAKEAEFLLGVLYPPSFKRSINWLTRAATWNPQAQTIVIETVEQSSSTSNEVKLFWLNISKLDQQDSFEGDRLINYESRVGEAGQEREYFLSIDDLVQVQRVHSRSASFSPDTQF